MPEISNDDVSTILGILKRIPLLEELNAEDHKEVIKQITLELYPPNHVIFKEGDPGDSFYIIKSGMVRVFHPGNDADPEEKDVAILGDNDFFGEMALISEKPRNASTVTVEETQCFKLKKEDFIKLVSSNPNMAGRISTEFLKRLKINLRGL
ncbi:cyclic nucleotide-binding domain-containing protein [Patescibacteria group bacterium]|nr:cyclic nucleotide-binding domain-containing protein [Patescibacteria group bacterium]MBU1953590.1 cyclic nucleotide-binding domain-containing protein [Patescibacteria group bacterium]